MIPAAPATFLIVLALSRYEQLTTVNPVILTHISLSLCHDPRDARSVMIRSKGCGMQLWGIEDNGRGWGREDMGAMLYLGRGKWLKKVKIYKMTFHRWLYDLDIWWALFTVTH